MFCMFCMFFLAFANTYHPYRVVYGEAVIEHKHQNCSLQESKNGIDAGLPHSIRAVCKYSMYLDKFYYEISWDHPNPPKSPVAAYRIFIMYGITHQICFQLPKFQRKLEFNETVGFIRGREFRYAVTPQPVVHVHGRYQARLKKAVACPVGPKLKPLPNTIISVGSNFSFQCEFEVHPVPKASISWWFTKDKTNCKSRRRIKNTEHIVLSKDKRLLQIFKVTEQDEGCYVLTAENSVDKQEQKGYLDVSTQEILPPVGKKTAWEAYGPLFGVILGTLFLIVSIFLLVMKTCLRTPSHHKLYVNPDEKKTVYISHCMEEEHEIQLLAQFASNIKSYSFDVIIDVCSEVQINSVGGFSRWIPDNIKMADKVIVVLTSSYLTALECRNGDDKSESIRKVHSEYNYINNILYNDLHYSKKVLIISKGVNSNKFPYVFKNKFYVEFPDEMDIDKDVHFRTIIGVLSEEEPLQLQNGHPHIMSHENEDIDLRIDI